MSKNIAVFGIYATENDATDAVEKLRRAGFRDTDVSMLLPDNSGNKDLAHEKHTKAPEGAMTGATTGAVIGGLVAWLTTAGALAVPGLEPLALAGPIVGTLAGVGAGSVGGGVIGGLIGLGIPEYEAKRFEGRIRKGGILVSVHCDNDDWKKTAKDTLKRTGAEYISSTTEAKADFARTDRPHPRHAVSRT